MRAGPAEGGVTPPAKAVANPSSSNNCFAAHASLPPRRSKPLARLRAERNVMLRHAQARARRRHAQGRPAAASRLLGSSCGTSSAFGAKRFSEWSWCFHPASFHFFLRQSRVLCGQVKEARNGRHRRPRPSKGRRSGKTSEQNRAAFGARGKSYKRSAPPLTQTKPVGAADTAQKHTPKLPGSPRMIARAHAAAFSPSHPPPIFTHQLSFRRGRPRRHRRRPLAPTLRAWRAAALAAALR